MESLRDLIETATTPASPSGMESQWRRKERGREEESQGKRGREKLKRVSYANPAVAVSDRLATGTVPSDARDPS